MCSSGTSLNIPIAATPAAPALASSPQRATVTPPTASTGTLTADATAASAEAERLRHRREQDQQASVLTSVGTAKFDGEDYAGALELFRRAVAASDQYAPAYYQMGRALQRLGRQQEANEAFARAAALNPSLAAPK